MAGTIVASTLSDGTNSTSTTNPIRGSAKAWVNFNGTGTVAIRSSYNVSSITDNGTGYYTVNFTNALTDANYAVAGAARYDGVASPTASRYVSIVNNGTLATDMSTSSVRVNVTYDNGAVQDPSVATVIIVR